VTATNVVAAAVAPTGGSGTGRLTGLRAAFRSPRLVVGTSIVGFFVLLAIFGPFFFSNPNALSNTELAGPSLKHLLGTTQIGQDVFAQLVVSARDSLLIGVGAGLLATVVSVIVGISGVCGRNHRRGTESVQQRGPGHPHATAGHHHHC